MSKVRHAIVWALLLSSATAEPEGGEETKTIEQRTFNLVERFAVPFLMGALLKMSAVLPVVLIIAIFVGVISLISSKLSLLISAILGIKSLMSTMMPAAPPEHPALTPDDLNELQLMLWKNSDHMAPPDHPDHHWPTQPEAVYYTPPPDEHHDHHSMARIGYGQVPNSARKKRISAVAQMAPAVGSGLVRQAADGTIGIKITKSFIKQEG